MRKRGSAAVEGQLLEQGDIFYFYRPRIDVDPPGPSDEEEMERLFIILHPLEERLYRQIVLSRRRQTPPGERERFWGLVFRVMGSWQDARRALGEQRLVTRNRGERRHPGAHLFGEGLYALVRHRDHTHLAYALEPSHRELEVQQELAIEDEASYIVSVKNPEQAASTFHPVYPRRLMVRFGERRWNPVDPVDYLDVEGTELVFISARKSAGHPEPRLHGHEERQSARILQDLKLQRIGAPLEPLFEGHGI